MRRWYRLVCLVLVAPSLALLAGAPVAAQEVLPLQPGLDLLTYQLPGPVVVHAVRVNRAEKRYDLRMAFPDLAAGDPARVPIPAMIERYDTPESPVLAAINGGFFGDSTIRGYLGDGVDLLQRPLDGERANHWPVFGWTTGSDILVSDSLEAPHGVLRFPDGSRVELHDLNRVRRVNTTILYTPDWGASTTTTAPGVEVILKEVTYPLRPSKWLAGTVVEIRQGQDAIDDPIPPDGAVISARDAAAEELLARAKVGQRVSFRFPILPREWDAAELLQSGAGWVVKDGRPNPEDYDDYGQYLPKRHPRTVLAWNDNYLYLFCVDGRQAEHSIGMDFHELAAFVIDTLEADQAVNLDGGGSSTLVVQGEIVNAPSDHSRPDGTGGVPRAVGNGLMLVDLAPAPRPDLADNFTGNGRRDFWEDRFTPNPVEQFSPRAPDGDGHVITVADPAGGYETVLAGSLVDDDVEVDAWLYCERNEPGRGGRGAGFERIGVFTRDDGHGAFDSGPDSEPALGGANNYLLTWDSDDGRVRAGKMVDGELIDLLPERVYAREPGWRRFRLRAEGATLRYWLDDRLLLETTDTTHAAGPSGIGYSDHFDNNARIRGTRADRFRLDRAPF